MHRQTARPSPFDRRGTALFLALVFAVILLQFGIAYTSFVRQSRPQTGQIDESVRLHYLARGLSDIALLKFQKFPADFYSAWRHAASTSREIEFWRDRSMPLASFTIDAPELTVENFTGSRSSFNEAPITIRLLEMRLLTDNRWNVEALRIRAQANYTDRTGRSIDTEAVRTVRTERRPRN